MKLRMITSTYKYIVITLLTTFYNSYAFVFDRIHNKHTVSNAILVIGGAGKTGSEIIYQSLKNNMNVTTLVRSSNKYIKVPEGSSKTDNINKNVFLNDYSYLNVVEGSVTSQNDIDECFSNNNIEGVIVALGGNPNKVGKHMLENGTKRIIESMKKYDCNKISIITSVGTGDSYEQAPLFFKGLMATLYRDMFVDKNNQEKLFDSGEIGHNLNWCIIRPGGLTLGPKTDTNIIPTNDTIGSISRADVAKFCIESISDSFEYTKQKVSISNLNAIRDHN